MILPALKSSSLVSLGQLCDDQCVVLLSNKDLHVIKDNKIIMQGKRNPTDGLWDIPIAHPSSHSRAFSQKTPHKINQLSHKIQVILRQKQSAKELAQYLHASCFSPVISTWIQAIKNNNFISWPGLTPDLIQKHLPLSQATVQGHLHRERQKLQSTKKSQESLFQTHLNKSTPTTPISETRGNTVNLATKTTPRLHQD